MRTEMTDEELRELLDWVHRARQGQVEQVPVDIFLRLDLLARGYAADLTILGVNRAIKEACDQKAAR